MGVLPGFSGFRDLEAQVKCRVLTPCRVKIGLNLKFIHVAPSKPDPHAPSQSAHSEDLFFSSIFFLKSISLLMFRTKSPVFGAGVGAERIGFSESYSFYRQNELFDWADKRQGLFLFTLTDTRSLQP